MMNQVEAYEFQGPEVHLRDYIRIIFARKWLVLLIFLVVMSAVIYYIQTTPPTYKAQVTLSYEDQSTSKLVLEGMQLKNARFPIDAEQVFLTSPPVVQDIVNYLTPVGPGDLFAIFVSPVTLENHDEALKDLVNQWIDVVVDYNQSISLPQPIGVVSVAGLTAIEIIDGLQKKIHRYDNSLKILSSRPKFIAPRASLVSADEIVDSITLSSPRDSTLVYLSAMADTPQKAALIANTAAYVYTKQVTERKGKDLDFAISFLRRQMQNVENQMEDSSKELYQFRKEQNLSPAAGNLSSGGKSSDSAEQASLTSQLGEYYAELNDTKDQIEIKQAQLEELNKQIAETKAQIGESDTLLTTTADLTTEITRLREKISDLELQKEVQLKTKTENHEDVINLDRQIEVTQDRLNQLLEKVKSSENTTTSSITEWDSLVNASVDLRTNLQGLLEKEKRLDKKIKDFEAQHPDLISTDLQLMRLERKVRVHDQRYLSLLNSQDQMALLKEMQTGGIDILKHANVPRIPVKPRKAITLMLGAVLGLMLGIGSSLFIEYMDDSIKRKEDVERYLNLEVVGTIPKIPSSQVAPKSLQQPLPQREHAPSVSAGNHENENRLSPNGERPNNGNLVRKKRERHSKGHHKRVAQLVSRSLPHLKSHSQVVESYRTLRSQIQFAAVDTEVKMVLLTSAAPGEGKTLTASNLAIAMAWNNMKILLIDCDLRRPRQHVVFGVPKSPGLSDYLTSDLDNAEEGHSTNGIICKTYVENLDLVTCGSIPPNPTELLNSKKFTHLIAKWRQEYDFILFDSPPVISVADASILATKVDRTLLVIKSGKTQRQIATQARDALRKVDADIFGVILNDVDYSKQYGYYYYYHYYRNYYYSADDQA